MVTKRSLEKIPVGLGVDDGVWLYPTYLQLVSPVERIQGVDHTDLVVSYVNEWIG